MRPFHTEILRVLLYYDIWAYPLTARELFTFLPVHSLSFEEFERSLDAHGPGPNISTHEGHYFMTGRTAAIVEQRSIKERHAKTLWSWARISMHVIKRFPFVRAIIVSGDLSKNATTPKSDVDFFIITEPGRLWIARTLLILFKKIFLLNNKKFFCLNYFTDASHLTLAEQNVFLATEIAHLKPLFNSELFFRYLDANRWIKNYFPNFSIHSFVLPTTNNRLGFLQKLFELPFSFLPADSLDSYLLNRMKVIWANRYPQYDDETRERLFRCTKHESRAYVGNFEEKILTLFNQKMKEYGVAD